MPRKTISDKQRRADLLAKVPPSATRVRVMTAKGEQKYKAIKELSDSDVIQTKRNGDPIIMKGKPGRKSTSGATTPANPTVAAILQRKKTALRADEILTQINTDPESADLLTAIIAGLGEEQASLKFEREEAAREGKDTSRLSSRRVQALRATAETWLKRRDQITNQTIDLESPGFMALYGFIMDTFGEAMRAARLRPEQVETVFSKFSSMITDDWKNEAKSKMRQTV